MGRTESNANCKMTA